MKCFNSSAEGNPMQFTYHAIGVIHSPFHTKKDCPIQGVYSKDAQGRIELQPGYAAGLKDIDEFSHLTLLYAFHQAGEVQLVRPPFLDDQPHGVFATRHPCRPNSIGLSIVRLLARSDNVLDISGVDVLDGTPLLDLKPYVPRFDAFPEADEGWLASKAWRPKPEDRE